MSLQVTANQAVVLARNIPNQAPVVGGPTGFNTESSSCNTVKAPDAAAGPLELKIPGIKGQDNTSKDAAATKERCEAKTQKKITHTKDATNEDLLIRKYILREACYPIEVAMNK
ncbi:hypothetical protein N0V83_008935 [Neocucurbitaria cava]|uniref:Uncharacterized protein n=1 Tax=Neocucurbitaria cava TaxID=798079 RepID=A0A9W8Y1C4_9PLEO|nr:hypothetical protein N0V83_008935 [Neocucurbitaria cava]